MKVPARKILKKPKILIGLLGSSIAVSYILTMMAAADMRPVALLDDAYIHYQYARQMALGQPWQYNPGDPISTGATSLLYPFLLAVAYRIGFQEDAIVWPAFLIGATSMVISALLVFQITIALYKAIGKDQAQGRTALIASLLFLLTGAIPLSYLNGMETGLFTMFVLAALHEFVIERPGRTALFLTISALIRPEGIFLAGVAWLVSVGQFISDRQHYRRHFGLMSVALLLASTPYLVNVALTGTPVATGAQAKSWFGNIPFVLVDLLGNMGRMTLLILERMILGFLASRPWPVVPGILLLALFGAVALWHRGARWTVLLVAGWFAVGVLAAATLITALWQGGRYQVPFTAILMPFIGVGIGTLLSLTRPRWRTPLRIGFLLWGILVIYSSLQGWNEFYDGVAGVSGQQVAMGDEIDHLLPNWALVSVHDAGAIRYIGNRDTYDMIGLTTQGAADAWRHGSGAVFELMERAANRPTHFATYPNVATIPYLAETSLFAHQLFETTPYGTQTIGSAGPVQVLYEADWKPAENKEQPQQSNIHLLTRQMTQVASIDLADLSDEEDKELFWTIGRTQPGFPTEVRQFSYRTDPHTELLDGGRLISGQVSFPISVTPGQELMLAARLHAQEPGGLAVKVNGRDAGLWRYPATPGQWLETTFLIQDELIDDSQLEIELQLVDQEGTAKPIGVYHLWAYQGQRPLTEIDPQVGLEYRFGPHIVLEGYDLAKKELVHGEDLSLTLYWLAFAEEPPDLDMKVFLHLYDAQGNIVRQIDQRPFFDTRPPYTWFPGEQIADPYRLEIPSDLEPGFYEIAVGMYNPSDNKRLDVTTPKGDILADGRIILDKILVRASDSQNSSTTDP